MEDSFKNKWSGEMTQTNLFFEKLNGAEAVQADSAVVVALDHEQDEKITLRFLLDGLSWGSAAKQVRLERDMAEQLVHMLADELHMSVA